MIRREGPGRARGLLAWGVASMACVFLLIGLAFIASPALGAAVFGIPAPDETAHAYVQALALRDLALGLYLLGLLRFASRRALGIVLAATVVIPLGDVLLVLAWTGWTGSLLLHGASAGATALLALGLLWSGAGEWDEEGRR